MTGASCIKALASFQQAFIGWEGSLGELPVRSTDSEQECQAVPISGSVTFTWDLDLIEEGEYRCHLRACNMHHVICILLNHIV